MSPHKEIHYRLGSPALGHFPGHHRSRRGDSGFEFRGHASLLDAPDPRRLDLHASLRDPLLFESGNWAVRVYSQRKSIPVAVVADLSASMDFAGKLGLVADFVDCLAWSAWRTGDSFGFVGCDDGVREDLLLPQSRARAAAGELSATLRALAPDRPSGRSALGLLQAHRWLPQRRALVFLLSDFHLPLQGLAQLLVSLSAHELVPVVLWDRREFALSAERGLAQVADPETGRQRLVWWRPALRERWAAALQERRDALLELFSRQRLRPLFLDGAFDADAVTRHFHA